MVYKKENKRFNKEGSVERKLPKIVSMFDVIKRTLDVMFS